MIGTAGGNKIRRGRESKFNRILSAVLPTYLPCWYHDSTDTQKKMIFMFREIKVEVQSVICALWGSCH